MGTLRTILALAVVVYHSYKLFGLRMCGGQVAVESFYMISGFYMALILNEKYIGVGSYKKFILSRFYRIFPVYWFVLFLALIISSIGYLVFNHPYYLARYISNYNYLSGITIFYFVFENIAVLGQDILYFTRFNENYELVLTYNPLSYKHNGYQYLLVPQAWSISIEFLFYLIAPFLVTKKMKWQIALVLIGLACKYYFSNIYYLRYDPWTYRFFPFEIAFFMAGSMAYGFFKYIQNKKIPSLVGYCLLILCVSGVIMFNEIPIEEKLKNNLFYCLILASLPFMFHSLKNNKIDRYIGELSFSIYIGHHIIVSVFRGYFFSHPQYLYFYGYAVVASSLIFAFLLQITIVNSIEAYRIKRFL
jgi:peptidoglycan/LPS O-acetylase OafA/YrhL